MCEQCEELIGKAPKGLFGTFGEFSRASQEPTDRVTPQDVIRLSVAILMVTTQLDALKKKVASLEAGKGDDGQDLTDLMHRHADLSAILQAEVRRIDTLTDRVYTLEESRPALVSQAVDELGEKVRGLAETSGRHANWITDQELKLTSATKAADGRIASLEGSLKAQGRQLEELMRWRDSVEDAEPLSDREKELLETSIVKSPRNGEPTPPHGDAEGGEK